VSIRKIIGLVLGVLGSLLGIIVGIGTLTGFFIPFSAVEKIPLGKIEGIEMVIEETEKFMGIWAIKGLGAIFLSIIGAVGTGIVTVRTEIGSWLMCVAGIGGFLISIPLYTMVVTPLFLIGGLLNNNTIITFLKRIYRYFFPPFQD
jgi:hypothetical protein